MNGRYIFFALAALLAVLCSFVSFLLFFLITISYGLFLYKYKHFLDRQLIYLIGVFLLFFLSSQLAVHSNKTAIPMETGEFYLEYDQNPKIDGDLLEVIAREKTFHEKILLHYQIKSEAEKKILESRSFYGRQCQVTGTLKQPLQAKNENAFNYREYLKHKQIFWILDSHEMPLKSCTPVKLNLSSWIKQLRFFGIKDLQTHFPLKVASISSALIYGDESLIAPETLAAYRKIGITHLLAISGLQVSLLIGLVFYLGIRLGGTREGVIDVLFISLPIYALLTGATPSVVRAVLMAFLVMITIRWKTKVRLLPIDAISIAFCLFLLFAPFSLYDVGFQLSFSVSLVIIISAPVILERYHNAASRMFTTTILAQIAALPCLLYQFDGMNFISIAANLLFIPLYSFLFLPVVFILTLCQLIIGTVPMPMIDAFTRIVSFSDNLAQILAQFSFFNFSPGRPSGWEFFVYLIILFMLLIMWEKQYWKQNRMAVLLLCCFLTTFQIAANMLNPFGEVTMIDVGQGDSTFIHLPFGKGNYLIDTGGTLQFNEEKWRKRSNPFEVGKDVVVPYLKAKGIRQIDKLILTHGDTDHIGGTLAVLKEMKVKQIVMPAVAEPSESEVKIMTMARKKGIQVYHTSAGDKWKAGDSGFFILSPEKDFSGERNMGSVVVFASIGGLKWFFGGDLPKEGEEKISKNHPNLSIDVLKVGHHGSKTSTSEIFLKQLKPKIALISVGEKNRFGHPHQEVLDRLKEIHTMIYRTDKQGQISYRFYHGKGTFSVYLP